jgi:2-dehydropantoate 2-reductase
MLEVLRQANILCDWRIDIQSCLWEKFIFISSFGLTTAAHRKTIGQVLEDDTLRGTVMAIIDEAVSIARGLGVPLPEHVAEAALQKGSEFPFETKTSLHHDVEQEARGDERDLFAGALLNYATELGIPTAATAQVLGTLEKIKPTL